MATNDNVSKTHPLQLTSRWKVQLNLILDRGCQVNEALSILFDQNGSDITIGDIGECFIGNKEDFGVGTCIRKTQQKYHLNVHQGGIGGPDGK